MHTTLAVQTYRNLKAQYRKLNPNKINSHPILDFTNIRKVFCFDTPGPMDNTWTRWLKVNYTDETSVRIDYGHTQTGETVRNQLADVLATLGFCVTKK